MLHVMQSRIRIRPLLPALHIMLTSSVVCAGNEDEFFVGNRAAMTAGAVTATVDDGSAVFYNPAGLGAVKRSSIDVSASAYGLRFYNAPGFLSTVDGLQKTASVTEFVSIPTELAYVRVLGNGLSLGLGYFVPRSSDLVLREHLDGPAVDGSSSWDFALRSNDTHYVLSAALGGRVRPWLRLGVGLFANYNQFVESVALSGSVARGEDTIKSMQIAGLDDGTAIGGQLVVGAQFDLTDRVSVGLTAKSPRVRFSKTLSGRFTSVTATLEDGTQPALASESGDLSEKGAARLVQLGRYHAGVAFQLAKGTLSLGADVQPGYFDAKAAVDQHFVINGRLAYCWSVSKSIKLGAGLFSDRSNENLSDALVSSQTDFYGTTFGVEISNLHKLSAHEPVDSLILSSVFALKYAYGTGDTRLVRGDPEAPVNALFSPASGTLTAHEFSLHVGSALYF